MEIDAMKMELRRNASFINRRWANSLECWREFEKSRRRGGEKMVRNDRMIGNNLLAFAFLLWMLMLEGKTRRESDC